MTAKTATPYSGTLAFTQSWPYAQTDPAISPLARIAKLESDRARLIEALRNLQECVLGYRTTGKPDYKTMSRLEDEARSLLGELEGK